MGFYKNKGRADTFRIGRGLLHVFLDYNMSFLELRAKVTFYFEASRTTQIA